jgi:hypothetical protein
MEDPKNTEEITVAEDRPEAAPDAVVKRPDPVSEATAGLISTESVRKAKSDIDRPEAPADAKPTPKKRAAAPKAATKKAPASKVDRPMVETGACDCCKREEVLEPFEVVKGVTLNICVVCKTDILAKADAIKAKAAA